MEEESEMQLSTEVILQFLRREDPDFECESALEPLGNKQSERNAEEK